MRTPVARPRWHHVSAVVGVVVLGLYVLAVAPAAGVVFVMASDDCFDGDARFICDPDGQTFVYFFTVGMAVGALLLSVLGFWVWPRRGWMIGVGYLVAALGFLVSFLVAVQPH